jgi:hypothetical protein
MQSSKKHGCCTYLSASNISNAYTASRNLTSQMHGMTSLRENVLKAASGLIAHVHQQCTSADDFIPPVLASARAFLAGCSIVTGIPKRWINRTDYVRDLINCTEILTMNAPHWAGGHSYLRVWKILLDLIDADWLRCPDRLAQPM